MFLRVVYGWYRRQARQRIGRINGLIDGPSSRFRGPPAGAIGGGRASHAILDSLVL